MILCGLVACSPGREASLSDSSPRDGAGAAKEGPAIAPDAARRGWSMVAVPTSANVDYTGVWGSGSDDVWVIGRVSGGGGFVARYGGSGWKEMNPKGGSTSLAPRAIWGSGPNDVWVVGDGGGQGSSSPIWHYDGNGWVGWSSQQAVTLTGVWGSSGSDVWAVGQPKAMRHYDGKSWTVVKPPPAVSGDADLYAIWGSARDDVWLTAGEPGFGMILHYDGTEWSVEPTPYLGLMYAIDGVGKEAVWASGGLVGHISYKTYKWQSGLTVPHLKTFWDVWAVSAREAWVVGEGGTIGRLGNAPLDWSTFDSKTTMSLRGIWGSSTSDVWVVGSGGVVLHYTGP